MTLFSHALSPAGDINVSEMEFMRLMGYPSFQAPRGHHTSQLATGARDWYSANGKPWTYGRTLAITAVGKSTVKLEDGTLLRSEALAEKFRVAEAHAVVVAAVSAGPEIDREVAFRWNDQRPDESYVLDAYGSAVAEYLVARSGAGLCSQWETHGVAVLPNYSPGYTGWNLNDQHLLFKLLSGHRAYPLPGPLSILSSGMLQPKKSLLTVFGLTKRPDLMKATPTLVPCTGCTFAPCAFRRAPYQAPRRHEINPASGRSTVNGEKPALAFPEKALAKWAANLLKIKEESGLLKAEFHYQGSTCSNGGVPLNILFNVTLEPGSEGEKIMAASCGPEPGDGGCSAMCAVVNSADFLSKIENDMPLLGSPLTDVLHWRPEVTPAGCLCSEGHRNHKWLMVLQTLYFQLHGGKHGKN